VLSHLLCDFDVCCLPEGLAPDLALLRRARRVRLIAQEANPAADVSEYMHDHGIGVVNAEPTHLIEGLRRRLEALQ
ncbi:MAG: hypothetical protein WCP21_24460, partial [Armatimonadota bacterium]